MYEPHPQPFFGCMDDTNPNIVTQITIANQFAMVEIHDYQEANVKDCQHRLAYKIVCI